MTSADWTRVRAARQAEGYPDDPEEPEEGELTHQAKHIGDVDLGEGLQRELQHERPDQDGEQGLDGFESLVHGISD